MHPPERGKNEGVTVKFRDDTLLVQDNQNEEILILYSQTKQQQQKTHTKPQTMTPQHTLLYKGVTVQVLNCPKLCSNR